MLNLFCEQVRRATVYVLVPTLAWRRRKRSELRSVLLLPFWYLHRFTLRVFWRQEMELRSSTLHAAYYWVVASWPDGTPPTGMRPKITRYIKQLGQISWIPMDEVSFCAKTIGRHAPTSTSSMGIRRSCSSSCELFSIALQTTTSTYLSFLWPVQTSSSASSAGHNLWFSVCLVSTNPLPTG